jgi:phage shock protein C
MFCPECGNQTPSEVALCSNCHAAIESPAPRHRVLRARQPRVIAGVCAGIALHYGWRIYIVRLIVTVAACLTVGAIAVIYLLAWVSLPEGFYALPASVRDTGPYAAY